MKKDKKSDIIILTIASIIVLLAGLIAPRYTKQAESKSHFSTKKDAVVHINGEKIHDGDIEIEFTKDKLIIKVEEGRK